MKYHYLKGSFRKQNVILVQVLLGLHQIIHLVGCYHQMCPWQLVLPLLHIFCEITAFTHICWGVQWPSVPTGWLFHALSTCRRFNWLLILERICNANRTDRLCWSIPGCHFLPSGRTGYIVELTDSNEDFSPVMLNSLVVCRQPSNFASPIKSPVP